MDSWHPTRRTALGALVAGAASASPLAGLAQAYPSKPIKIVVGYSAGGAVDIVARTLGQALGASVGQSVIVENKPGAGTNIAVKYVIDAAPDGYTLLMAANALAANMALYQPPPFDAERDLVAVSMVGRVPVVIAANPQAPFGNVAQLIAAAKAKPGSISFASPGNGSTPHMAMELFARAAGIQLQHVPYKGGAQAITDVMGGQLPLLAINALEVKGQAQTGKLKVLAVLSPHRSNIFPDVPTIAESGFPGFEASVWYTLMAPARTPKEIVAKLHDEVQKALKTPEVQNRMTAVGGEVSPGTQQDAAALIHSERLRYDKLVRDAHIKPD
jgi:tripartite-type tricarboxylate transporter receptor subunit TctC